MSDADAIRAELAALAATQADQRASEGDSRGGDASYYRAAMALGELVHHIENIPDATTSLHRLALLADGPLTLSPEARALLAAYGFRKPAAPGVFFDSWAAVLVRDAMAAAEAVCGKGGPA